MNIEQELKRIQAFIHNYIFKDDTIIVFVSSGVDSDVAARLCVNAVGNKQVRLVTILENDMKEKFIVNVRNLAKDLKVELSEIDLRGYNKHLIRALEESDKGLFNSSYELEVGKAKCHVRASVISSYQDKGFVVCGTVNKTEHELGFFVTFSNNLCNFNPIRHLYKSEVIELGKRLGTRKEVLEQEPTPGFWLEQTDKEDLAYWIINGGPILKSRNFSSEEQELVSKWKDKLSVPIVDKCVYMLINGASDEVISEKLDLDIQIVKGLRLVREKAKKYKTRKLFESLEIN